MKPSALFTTLLLAAGLFVAADAQAQPAPPPPPPPPEAGPEYAPPPPPPPGGPAYHGCGAYGAHPCAPPPAYSPPRRVRRPFWHLGPYVGFGGGGFGILDASGPFQYISSGGFGNLYVGMNFTRHFALELAFIGSAHDEEWGDVPNALLLWGVTLDAKFNLVRPSWRHRFIPYLQAGAGVYGLYSDSYVGSTDLAKGGGFQAGGGLDIYLTRWLTLGGRLLYRGISMGSVKDSCGEQCVSSNPEDRTFISGLTGEINMSIVF